MGDEPWPIAKFLFVGGIPVIVAGVMMWLFMIKGGAATVQFNVGSPSRMNVWSTWVSLWQLFLLVCAASGLGNFIWLVVCAVKKSMRECVGIAIATFLLSVLAFFTVASYFPSA